MRSSKKKFALMVGCAIILSSVLTLSLTKNHDANDPIKARALYSTHDAIYIASNEDWASSGFPGDGTEGDPYVISGYDITGVGGDAINIQGTTVHFVIDDCYAHGDGNGIYLANAENATLTNNNCSANAYDGIRVSSDFNNLSLNLSGNILLNNGWYGLEANAYPGNVTAVIAGCNVSGNSYGGIYLEGGNNLNLTMSGTNVTFNGGYGIEIWSDTWDIVAVLDECNVSDNSDNGMWVEATNNLNLTVKDTVVTWNAGSGMEAYADSGNIVGYVDRCNVSDNGWTGIYMQAQADLNLTMNNTDSLGNSQSGGWSAGLEVYASNGNLVAGLSGCNLSLNGNEGIYAAANNNLNLTVIDSVLSQNDVSWGFSCGIEAYSYADLNMTLIRSEISDHGDQGIYMEADNNIYLTFDETKVVRNQGGDYGGYGVQGYTYYGDIVAAMDGCNISENYDDGIYLEATTNLDLNLSGCTISWNQGYGIEGYAYDGAVTAAIDGCNISHNYFDGIYLDYSEYSTIANTTCSSNGGSGMNLNSYYYGLISNNTCRFNGQNGISVSYSSESIVSNNTCADNGGDGIYVVGCSASQISRNLVFGNLGYGLALYFSSGTIAWNNTFLFNRGSTTVWDSGTVQAYDDGTNAWNTEGTPHGWGNFWSDWMTPDDDMDGIVDVPYIIDGGAGAEDNYPLAKPMAGFTKHVFGIVRDTGGNPISGADVIVTMLDGETVVLSKTTHTDSSGMYEVSFDWLEWNVGYTIEVTATYNGVEETNSSSADLTSAQEVDITYPFAIPQFGSLLGFLLAGALVGVVGIVLLRRRR